MSLLPGKNLLDEGWFSWGWNFKMVQLLDLKVRPSCNEVDFWHSIIFLFLMKNDPHFIWFTTDGCDGTHSSFSFTPGLGRAGSVAGLTRPPPILLRLPLWLVEVQGEDPLRFPRGRKREQRKSVRSQPWACGGSDEYFPQLIAVFILFNFFLMFRILKIFISWNTFVILFRISTIHLSSGSLSFPEVKRILVYFLLQLYGLKFYMFEYSGHLAECRHGEHQLHWSWIRSNQKTNWDHLRNE